jgi:hypothetical protein
MATRLRGLADRRRAGIKLPVVIAIAWAGTANGSPSRGVKALLARVQPPYLTSKAVKLTHVLSQ